MNKEKIFTQEIEDSVHDFNKHGLELLAQGKGKEEVLLDCLQGLAHTFLVILDGGTKLSDKMAIKVLADDTELNTNLHEILVFSQAPLEK